MEFYKLVREGDNHCKAVFVRNEKMDGCLDGDLYEVSAWCDNEVSELDYIANAYIKWDACSHFRFNGEGYEPGDKDEDIDPYYHICGACCYKDFMRNMAFVYKLATQVMDRYDEDEFKEILEVHSNLLEGYKIEKVDKIDYFEIRETYKNEEER